MQIGPNKLLSFLPGIPPTAAQAAKKDSTASPAAVGSDRIAPLRESTPTQEDAGVILAIRSEAPADAGAAPSQDLVYSSSRKSPARAEESDTERMAVQHQQAVERHAGSVSSLNVDKDGVLVAEPASPAEIKAQQFVRFAVDAMREYADATDRIKTTATLQESSASAASLLPRSLVGVQRLAARFNMFA
jgi:hypothetical protein